MIGSHFLQLESKYTTFISTHKIDELGTNGSIKLTLQSKGYSKTYDLESYDDNSLYEIEFDVSIFKFYVLKLIYYIFVINNQNLLFLKFKHNL